MKKITAYTWAFILLLIAFFTTGLFTLGDCASKGDALTLKANSAAYYSVESGAKIDSVYVNIGSVYAQPGENVSLTVKTTTATTPTTNSSWSVYGSALNVANVYGKDNLEGNNYNWIEVGSGLNKSATWLSITASKEMQINEIVCVNVDGELVSLKTGSAANYTLAELGAAIDAPESLALIIDEETGAYSISNDAYYNLAQEEGFYMSAVQTVLDGKTYLPDVTYNLDGSYNYLATLLMVPSVAVFGNSAFAIRLPAFIATCMMMVFAFLLVNNMLKNDKFAFLFAVVFAIGGLATSLGRFGAPYAMVASALVASLYFMHRFFAKGIQSKRIAKSGATVLLSGTFAAVAMAMDMAAFIPVLGILVLFVFGLRRQTLAYKIALDKCAGKEEEAINENGERILVNVAAEKATATYKRKNRICYGFAALSFVMITLVLLLLSSVLCYSAYVKATGNSEVGFLTVVWHGIKGSFRSNVITTYDATNKANVFAWFIPFRPATVYTGVTAAAKGEYIAWTMMANPAILIGAAAALVGATAKVIYDYAVKATSKKALRFRRMYFILLGGMACAMGAAATRGNASMLSSMLFHVFYIAFLPLVATLLPEGETFGEKAIINVAIWTIIAVFIVMFALCVPAFYGTTVPTETAKLFTWTSIRSNGWFRA